MANSESGAQTLPLLCLDEAISSPAALTECVGCPVLPNCIAYNAARHIVEQEAEINQLDQQLSQAEELLVLRETDLSDVITRLLDNRHDSLVPTTLTPEGLKDLLRKDAGLRAEILARRWGAIRLDGRFVGHANTMGNDVGDGLLEAGGRDIGRAALGAVRHKERRAKEAGPHLADWDVRRLEYPFRPDIVVRQGGDEFTILVRRVSLQGFQRAAARIESHLTVDEALRRYDNGMAPFIASVGIAHCQDLQQVAVPAGDAWALFNTMNTLADEGQRASKTRQYAEMWAIAHDLMPREVAISYDQMPDKNEVARLFLQYRCPGFYTNPRAYLG